MNGWAKVKDAARYSGVSVRLFRDWLKDPRLRRVVMPSGTILIRYSWVDEYLSNFETKPADTVNDIVNEVMKGLTNGN